MIEALQMTGPIRAYSRLLILHHIYTKPLSKPCLKSSKIRGLKGSKQ